MPGELIRIFSDIHYGDRASGARRLPQLRPLLDGVSQLVLNGDTLETRVGPDPAYTAAIRAEVAAFFPREVPRVTYLTGNHDPDFSPLHTLDLAGGEVFLTHGDILHPELVPWSADAPVLRARIEAGLAAMAPADRERLEARFALWRRVAMSVPQRHQSERHHLKYAWRFARDTVWPPMRIVRILRAWFAEPSIAAAFALQHRPGARFVLLGHTHRPGFWRRPDGRTIINTGSFCPPLGGTLVDLQDGQLTVRRVEARGGEFRPGRTLAQFPLAKA